MNRLLLVSYSWPPVADVGSIRSIKLAKYLVRLGWEVRVLTVSNPDVWRILGDAETPTGVEAVRVHDPLRLDRFALAAKHLLTRNDGDASPFLGTRGAIVPDVQCGWIPPASRVGIRLARRWATHILATGPPFSSLIVGARIARATGLPLVSDFQDSWTIHPDTRYPTAIQERVDADLERSVFESSSALTTVTETIAERYDRRFRVIPNGVDAEDLPPPAGAGPPRDGRAFRIVYTGSFYPHTPPSTLLASLSLLHDKDELGDVHADFYGRPEPAIDSMIEELGLQGFVTQHGFVPLKEAVRAASEADLLYFLLPRHFGEALSDKLFTYIATGVPILAEIPDGEAKNLLWEWAPGTYFVGPGDSRGMTRALKSAIDAPRKRAVRDGFLDIYGRDNIARAFDELLRSL